MGRSSKRIITEKNLKFLNNPQSLKNPSDAYNELTEYAKQYLKDLIELDKKMPETYLNKIYDKESMVEFFKQLLYIPTPTEMNSEEISLENRTYYEHVEKEVIAINKNKNESKLVSIKRTVYPLANQEQWILLRKKRVLEILHIILDIIGNKNYASKISEEKFNLISLQNKDLTSAILTLQITQPWELDKKSG
ncbi:hypothetical protein FJY84_03330 [Candidatus Bathyarchaeota archaeon]|nr:hypothetical protein [Candidatus Bathyarchaeota archaeon]